MNFISEKEIAQKSGIKVINTSSQGEQQKDLTASMAAFHCGCLMQSSTLHNTNIVNFCLNK